MARGRVKAGSRMGRAAQPASEEPKSDTVDSRAAPGTLESGKSDIENWADKPDSKAYIEATRLYPLIVRCYDNKQQQADNIEEYWHIYNAEPDDNQQYMGNSQGYVPAVRDCINARTKRTLKQLFPNRYRHVEAIGADPETPYPQLSLLEHYIRQTKLKDIVRSDLVAGDVTGQWNLYIDWTRSYRRVTNLVKRNPIVEEAGGVQSEVPLIDPSEEEEALEQEDILEEGPDIVDFATEDIAILPPTCNDIEKSEASCIRLRMSADKVRQMVDEGVFVLPAETTIKKFADGGDVQNDAATRGRNPQKQRVNEAGIRTEGTTKYALIFETAAKLDFGGGVKELGLIYYAGENEIVGIIKAPWWGGRRPTISAPTERVQGSFFGRSKVEPVKFLQWQLTDFWNMGQDSAMYSMLPIVMTDPLANPNYASMVIGLAAVWAVDPNKTKFAEFPQLWEKSVALCDAMKRQIWQSMDVNEMTMGIVPQGRKNNAMIGGMQQEQAIGIMDQAERYEEVMLNPLVERMFEYDCQFRTSQLTIMTKGELGVKAKMQEIEPQQWGQRYFFWWAGTQIVGGAQMMQQQIAAMNVLRGIPPQQLNGRKLDITPIVEKLTENVFGPEVAPRILIDERNLFTIDAATENEMMHNNIMTEVHPSDDDIVHIQQHQQGARLTQDPGGRFRSHLAQHMMQLQTKRQTAMGAQQQQGQGGMPGMPGPSAGVNPGVAGTPRMGAQPGAPHNTQNPPGAVAADNMVDAGAMGRG